MPFHQQKGACRETQQLPREVTTSISHFSLKASHSHPGLCWPVSPSEEASFTTKTQQHCPQVCREQTPHGPTCVYSRLLLSWWGSIKSNFESHFLGQSSKHLSCLAQTGYNVLLGVPAKRRRRHAHCCSILQLFWGRAIVAKVIVDLKLHQAYFRFSKSSSGKTPQAIKVCKPTRACIFLKRKLTSKL